MRKPKPRVHYLADARFLSTLSQAVEEDRRLDSDTRRKIVQHLSAASTTLISLSAVFAGSNK